MNESTADVRSRQTHYARRHYNLHNAMKTYFPPSELIINSDGRDRKSVV